MGVLPAPASVAAQLRLHRVADECLAQVMLRAQSWFWADPRNAELVERLIGQAEAIRAKAGPRVSMPDIARWPTQGMEDKDGEAPTATD